MMTEWLLLPIVLALISRGNACGGRESVLVLVSKKPVRFKDPNEHVATATSNPTPGIRRNDGGRWTTQYYTYPVTGRPAPPGRSKEAPPKTEPRSTQINSNNSTATATATTEFPREPTSAEDTNPTSAPEDTKPPLTPEVSRNNETSETNETSEAGESSETGEPTETDEPAESLMSEHDRRVFAGDYMVHDSGSKESDQVPKKRYSLWLHLHQAWLQNKSKDDEFLDNLMSKILAHQNRSRAAGGNLRMPGYLAAKNKTYSRNMMRYFLRTRDWWQNSDNMNRTNVIFNFLKKTEEDERNPGISNKKRKRMERMGRLQKIREETQKQSQRRKEKRNHSVLTGVFNQINNVMKFHRKKPIEE